METKQKVNKSREHMECERNRTQFNANELKLYCIQCFAIFKVTRHRRTNQRRVSGPEMRVSGAHLATRALEVMRVRFPSLITHWLSESARAQRVD